MHSYNISRIVLAIWVVLLHVMTWTMAVWCWLHFLSFCPSIMILRVSFLYFYHFVHRSRYCTFLSYMANIYPCSYLQHQCLFLLISTASVFISVYLYRVSVCRCLYLPCQCLSLFISTTSVFISVQIHKVSVVLIAFISATWVFIPVYVCMLQRLWFPVTPWHQRQL